MILNYEANAVILLRIFKVDSSLQLVLKAIITVGEVTYIIIYCRRSPW